MLAAEYRYEPFGETSLASGVADSNPFQFNDPVKIPDPQERAVRMALEMRDVIATLRARWQRQGFELGAGFGIGTGYDRRRARLRRPVGLHRHRHRHEPGGGVAQHGQILVSDGCSTPSSRASKSSPSARWS